MKKLRTAPGIGVRGRAAALLAYLLSAGCGDAVPRTEPPAQVAPQPEFVPPQADTALPSATSALRPSPGRSAGASPTDEAGPSPATTLPTLRFLREYGCEACSGPELFDLIRGVAVGSGRSFAVLTWSAPFVRVWNLDSNSAAQFGAEGDGPGELRRPIGIALFHDSVMVFDNRGARSRIEVYTPTGTHVGYASPPDPSPIMTFEGYSASPSGNWTLWATRPFQSQSRRIIRIDTGSGLPNRIDIPPQLLSESADPLAAVGVSAAVSDEGLVALGAGHEYKLVLLSSEGAPLTYGGRDIPRRVRSQEELDSMQAQIERAVSERNVRRPPALDRNRLREVPHFARDGLAFDKHNRLWVKTTHGRNTTMFDIFAPNLEYLGSVELDDPYILNYHIGASLVVASSASPTGVPVVKVWSLVEP